ncbi:TrbI F-type domain-containing protein [Legionella pneumophila]|uniref:TrbI F-type domain-containing protein n=1 Tax=Legionella pneumophila TaxID=446 RepID=UPI00077085A1|nr:TrbI F-type domain-containing protein [Legionella pneumophila]CZP45216.1 type-F conjugative transfer system protein TrbI [Legionella pneumophila]
MNKLVCLWRFIVIPLLILQCACFWLSKPTQIGTVDIVAITSDFVRSEAKKHHSKQKKEAAIKSFSHRLETALSDLSQSHSLILVPKEAVIKGGTDYTQTVLSLVQKGSES